MRGFVRIGTGKVGRGKKWKGGYNYNKCIKGIKDDIEKFKLKKFYKRKQVFNELLMKVY